MGKIKQKLRHYKNRFKQEHVQVTLYFLRIILAVVVMITLFTPKRNLSLLLFIIAMLLGFIEYRKHRRLQIYSQFNSILNALADKLLVDLSALALFMTGILPFWVFALFITKDLIFAIRGILTLRKNRFTIFTPTSISKITFFFQVIAILAILFDKLDTILLWTAVVFTVINIIVTFFTPEFKLVRRRSEFDEFAFRKLLKIADFITLGNVFLGLFAIVFTITDQLHIAVILLLIAVAVDFLDGKIARITKTQNEFGKQLDSLADTISFGVAPTVIGFSLIQTKLAIIAFSIFLLCGILRLAKFNIMDAKGYYIGMPITINGIIIPLVYLFGLPSIYYPYLYLTLGVLMVAPVSWKKKI